MRKRLALSLIGILTLPATQAAALEQVEKSETRSLGSLHIPDEVAPAVIPYFDCRLQSLGVAINGKDGKPIKSVTDKGGDCSALRTKAATDADALLVKAGKSASYRTAMVDGTLKSIDDFADAMGQTMAGAKAKSS